MYLISSLIFLKKKLYFYRLTAVKIKKMDHPKLSTSLMVTDRRLQFFVEIKQILTKENAITRIGLLFLAYM